MKFFLLSLIHSGLETFAVFFVITRIAAQTLCPQGLPHYAPGSNAPTSCLPNVVECGMPNYRCVQSAIGSTFLCCSVSDTAGGAPANSLAAQCPGMQIPYFAIGSLYPQQCSPGVAGTCPSNYQCILSFNQPNVNVCCVQPGSTGSDGIFSPNVCPNGGVPLGPCIGGANGNCGFGFYCFSGTCCPQMPTGRRRRLAAASASSARKYSPYKRREKNRNH